MSSQLSNPFDDYNEKLKQRLILRMKANLFNEQLMMQTKDHFTAVLQQEQIVFTRNEKRRMYKEVLQQVFDEILADI